MKPTKTPQLIALTDAQQGYGPHMFVVTDERLTPAEAALVLETAVTKVKEFFPNYYSMDDLLRYIASHDLGLVAVEVTRTAVNW